MAPHPTTIGNGNGEIGTTRRRGTRRSRRGVAGRSRTGQGMKPGAATGVQTGTQTRGSGNFAGLSQEQIYDLGVRHGCERTSAGLTWQGARR